MSSLLFGDFLSNETLGFLAASAALKYAIFYAWHKKIPEKAKLVGRISGLYIHPIKSCGTVSLKEAQCEYNGLYSEGFCDRTWLITVRRDDFYKAITARREPTIELIQPSFHGNFLHIDAPGMETLKINKVIHKRDGALCNTDLWGRPATGVDCGEKAAEWLGRYLKKDDDFHLIYYAPELDKGSVYIDLMEVEMYNGIHEGKDIDKVSYQDVAPLSIGSDVSLRHLNSKLEQDVSMAQFRMNIAVDECSEPYDEDRWDEIWVGNAKFTKFHLCDRCNQTTVDPKTAVPHPHNEPKRTLNKYRNLIPYAGPIFGVTLLVDRPETIKVGDPIYATKVNKIDVGTAGFSVSV